MKHDPKTDPKSRLSASDALNALTASAMALPGLAGIADVARADGPVEMTTIDQEFSYYKEDKLRPKKTAFGGERERMEIYSYQFRASTPLTERSDLDVAGTVEKLSGASPWFVLPGDPSRDNRPVQVMSGATIDEQRGDLLGAGNYYFDQGKVTGSAGFSIENDYYAVNFGAGGERSFNEKNTTLSLGINASLDWLEPTDCEEFNRVCSENKQSVNVYAGLSQILTRHSAIQSTFSFGYATGFLSDPYKLAFIESNGATVADNRPDDRKQFTWFTQYRHHVSGFNGTLHFDYKLYVDDWSMNSHTFDIAWYQTLPWGIQITPNFRYYSQSQADFYENFYPDLRSDGLASSDYRLSPFGAITYGLKATKTLIDWPGEVDWEFALSYERYESSAGMAFQSVDNENPGLVSFRVFAGRITVKF